MKNFALLLLLSGAWPATLRAQHEAHAAPATADTSIALFSNLGPHTRPITTKVPAAQAYFNQGMRLAYGFGMPEARRSFEAAIARDSSCAMCHWGLAWSLGPYVNGGMDSTRGVRAYRAIQRAKALSANASDTERALIDAMVARYVELPKRGTRAPADTAYMKAMREVAKRYPRDLDVLSLFGESMMVLRPWNYWTRAGAPQPGIEELVSTLETALSRDPRHPGACHLYIHTVEASTNPARAESCADLLIDGMPGASHMRHMPSHIYMRIGRYADGVRSNQLAWIADQQAKHGGATAIYPAHNLHMLLFAAAYDGQSAVALQAARDLAKLESGAAHHHLLTLARFGRWDEILAMPAPDRAFRLAIWHYARGLAELRIGQPANARISLGALDAAVADSLPRGQRVQLRLARAILSAEIDAAAKKYDAAVQTLERARIVESDSLEYDEPEEWIVPVRQVLGAILLDAGRAADAEVAYRGELTAHPENGWSLYGLHRALDAQGKKAEADAALARFRKAFARADISIRSSRF
jgi:tetratricopeptide (TPR) repeat protein